MSAPGGSLARPLLLLASVVACLVAVYASPLDVTEDVDRLRALLEEHGDWSPIVFTLICMAGVAVGLPRLAFAAAAGLIYGWALGFLLAHAGSTSGNVLVFWWSRWLGREFVARRAGPRLGRLLDRIRRHPIGTNVLLRVCPVGSSFLVTLVFGISPVSTGQFVVGTFAGMLPGTLALALFGSSAAAESTPALLLGAALLLGMWLGSRALARRSGEAAETVESVEALTADDSR
jgi:uncharacterized membrane protein YdjX (TVP38/TMEM64 family)